jgi:hypothetical protein
MCGAGYLGLFKPTVAGVSSCLAMLVKLLFSILQVWLGYQSFLGVLMDQLELLVVALVFLRLLLHLGVLMIVAELEAVMEKVLAWGWDFLLPLCHL